MRYYDYNKARQLIEQFKPVSASLGMREDWSWTASEIYEHGQFTVELFSGDIVKAATESIAELSAALKEVTDGAARLDLRSSVPKKYGHELNGLCGSCWATPSIRMEFEDGTERHFECFIQSGEQSEPYVRPMLGVLSGPCQDAIEDVPLEPAPPLTQPGPGNSRGGFNPAYLFVKYPENLRPASVQPDSARDVISEGLRRGGGAQSDFAGGKVAREDEKRLVRDDRPASNSVTQRKGRWD